MIVVNTNSLISAFLLFAFGNNNTALYCTHWSVPLFVCLFAWCASSFPSYTMRHLVTFKSVASQTIRRGCKQIHSRCWMVARWRRRAGEDSARLRCKERVEDNRDQTEHSEQLPGVNYIMSLCDREASKRSCCACVCVCVRVACCHKEWMPRLWLKWNRG